MGESALVETQISDASDLVTKLDDIGMSPTLVAWYYYDDLAEWQLLLAGPRFDELLPKQEALAYRKIAEALSAASPGSLALSDIKLVRTDLPLAKTIRMLIRTPSNGIMRAHFANNSVNGIFIKEMMLLRAA
jgi:hypothetical protein